MKSAHPMGVLSSLTSALIAFNPENETKLSLKESDKSENDEKLYIQLLNCLQNFQYKIIWTLKTLKDFH